MAHNFDYINATNILDVCKNRNSAESLGENALAKRIYLAECQGSCNVLESQRNASDSSE